MSRNFLIALPDGASREVACQVVMLDVGGERHRFAIHGTNLSYYRTGRRIGSVWGIGRTPRAVAQERVNALIEAHGLERVRAELAKHPTLNR